MRRSFVMRLHHLGFLAALPLLGCSNDSQVLTGHVAAGFPQAITSVEIVRGSTVLATAPVDASGSFSLQVAAGTGLALRLVGAAGHDTIVFPRKTGTIDRTFSVRPGAAAFDFGEIRFVGDASSTKFAFHDSSSSSMCDDSGHDSSGAMCCDDGGGDDDGGTCEGSGAGSGTETGSGGTGSGSGTTGTGSGSAVIMLVVPDHGGDDGSASDNDTDEGDGVCEHDMPDGCSGEGSDDGGHDGDGGGAQEADLPYDVKPQLGATATPILDAFKSNGAGVVPTAIVNVTMDAPNWRLTELQNSTPFVVTADDCSHIGNSGAAGRDRVFVTWTNADGSTDIDHLDIEYCSQ
jgi:hypothetical protein